MSRIIPILSFHFPPFLLQASFKLVSSATSDWLRRPAVEATAASITLPPPESVSLLAEEAVDTVCRSGGFLLSPAAGLPVGVGDRDGVG